jgi:hypothetical protein
MATILPQRAEMPPRPIGQERFVLEVSYQYDTWMAASGSEHYFRFEADAAGTVKALGDSQFIPGPPMPFQGEVDTRP